MKKHSVVFVVLAALLLVAFAAYTAEDTTWGRIKATFKDDSSPAMKKGGSGAPPGEAPTGDPAVLAKMRDINEELAAKGMNIAVEAVEFFTIGQGRPSNRIHQQPFRWVAGDPRRLPGLSGNDITYLVDLTYQGATPGVPPRSTRL